MKNQSYLRTVIPKILGFSCLVLSMASCSNPTDEFPASASDDRPAARNRDNVLRMETPELDEPNQTTRLAELADLPELTSEDFAARHDPDDQRPMFVDLAPDQTGVDDCRRCLRK